jgi:hypothetical protein
VNALANPEVGRYLNSHFVSSFQKVGAFRIVDGRKQGGNVASYFCTADGQVLHVVAGPVNASVLLFEARWAVETWKLAILEHQESGPALQAFFRKAHAERLKKEHGVTLPSALSPNGDKPAGDLAEMVNQPQFQALNRRSRIHAVLANYPLIPIEQVYRVVFENILDEKVTTNPVEVAKGP